MRKRPTLSRSIYTVGGTVQAGSGVYISREADAELLDLCRRGVFAYVLTPRQLGKSSLMVHTAQQLRDEDVRAAIVDLTQIGVQVTPEQWYLGLILTIADSLMLETDLIEWWEQNSGLGMTQKLTHFFQKVLLAETSNQVVIFIDEVDSTISAPFADDFYVAIRYLYNARVQAPEFRRLSFVMLGVATPSDLVKDSTRTPFNIGERVDLTDFTFDEALPLAEGLGPSPTRAREVFSWVMNWTSGHPYLTQRLCSTIAHEHKSDWTRSQVDDLVGATFFGERSKGDSNLRFVGDMLTRRAPNRVQVLTTYREIYRNRRQVADEEHSKIKSHLKLSGIVLSDAGQLHVRNLIYKTVFDERWIEEHFPADLRVIRMLGVLAVLISLVLFFGVLYPDSMIARNAFRLPLSVGLVAVLVITIVGVYRLK